MNKKIKEIDSAASTKDRSEQETMFNLNKIKTKKKNEEEKLEMLRKTLERLQDLNEPLVE